MNMRRSHRIEGYQFSCHHSFEINTVINPSVSSTTVDVSGVVLAWPSYPEEPIACADIVAHFAKSKTQCGPISGLLTRLRHHEVLQSL